MPVDYDYKGLYVQDRKLNDDALRLTFKDSDNRGITGGDNRGQACSV